MWQEHSPDIKANPVTITVKDLGGCLYDNIICSCMHYNPYTAIITCMPHGPTTIRTRAMWHTCYYPTMARVRIVVRVMWHTYHNSDMYATGPCTDCSAYIIAWRGIKYCGLVTQILFPTSLLHNSRSI
jgi:hypothetical protein